MYDISTPIIIRQTAQRIDYLRAENNFTYRDLSKKSDVSLATIHNIIQCKKIPNIYTLLYSTIIPPCIFVMRSPNHYSYSWRFNCFQSARIQLAFLLLLKSFLCPQ